MSKLSITANRMEEARRFWCDLPQLGEGRRVRLRRPDQFNWSELKEGGAKTLDFVVSAAVGWEGVTDADLLGPEFGADAPAAFDVEAWRLLVSDDVEMLSHCFAKMLEVVNAHWEKVKAARGN